MKKLDLFPGCPEQKAFGNQAEFWVTWRVALWSAETASSLFRTNSLAVRQEGADGVGAVQGGYAAGTIPLHRRTTCCSGPSGKGLFAGIIALSLCCAGFAEKLLPDPVSVAGGKIQGTAAGELTVYKGIPFAEPPVGELRWKAPEPVKPRDGVLETTTFAPSPMQGGNPPAGKSEDCLYLNIWTPAKSADEKIPVLVWIYGGGFAAGSAAEPICSGEQLAKKGVVFVSITYRVGILGFMAHPELSAETPNQVSGNYGLLDQIAGLQWIRKNIGAFGGDPKQVTIFGESAGGISVSMLCASPQAKGLFDGAISQSGGSFGPPRPTAYPGENMSQLAEAAGLAYAERAGVPSLAELRKIPADQLPAGRGWPIIDGWVIPDDQYKLYEAGTFNDTPILVGYNSDEGLGFFSAPTRQAHVDGVKQRFGPFADRLLEAYPVGPDNTVPHSARNLMRDAAFGWHTWSWARLQSSKGKSKAFLYYFDQLRDEAADTGAAHGREIPYVFQHLHPSPQRTTESDREISETMATYWTNFAKRGDPNGPGVPEWPPFSENKDSVMVFRQAAQVGPVPDLESLEVLDDYFTWRRTPQGAAWAK